MPDPGAGRFDKLMAPHLSTLFRVAYRLVRNPADAEDLVQDTCVAACENAEALASAQHPVRWLLRVMHNRFIDGARRRQRSPLVCMPDDSEVARMADDGPDPEELLRREDSERLLQEAFLRLDENQRTLLVLSAEGYGLAEMDAVLGIGKEAISARLFRARRSLVQELTKLRGPEQGRRRAGGRS